MFHLKYPRVRGFFSWVELGCLSRALGFPIELFRDNVAEEIEQEETGLVMREVYRMLDNRLLERALHRTVNLHTAEWNMLVFRKSVTLLDHHAITFQDLHDIRLAYQTYEEFDMMGMRIDQETLLSTIKMCRRNIAPLKLINRVKHMKPLLNEKGRIQLDEFLDLILWCGVYENYDPKSMTSSKEMDNGLFKLLDFEKLLSYHDQHLAHKLNQEYLQEEWDFGRENLGSRHMSKEPPIKTTADRINNTRRQKKLYRSLKQEVIRSQKMVYRTKAGFVRERPLTAPDLRAYQSKPPPPQKPEFTAQHAYEMMKKKLESTIKIKSSKTSEYSSDRPRFQKELSEQKPRVIQGKDLEEAQSKVAQLQFEIETLDGRTQINKEDMLKAYFPTSLEKTNTDEGLKKKSYPGPTHSNSTKYFKKKLVSTTQGMLETSDKRVQTRGQHMAKQVCKSPNSSDVPEKASSKGEKHTRRTDSRKKAHKFTVNQQRPATAPATLKYKDSLCIPSETILEKDLSSAESVKTADTGYSSATPPLHELSREELSSQSSFYSESSPRVMEAWKSMEKLNECSFKSSRVSSPSHCKLKTNKIYGVDKNKKTGVSSTKAIDSHGHLKPEAPIPHMIHSKPRTVSVGGIGQISLLESISEARYWEEVCQHSSVGTSDDESSDDSGVGYMSDNEGDESSENITPQPSYRPNEKCLLSKKPKADANIKHYLEIDHEKEITNVPCVKNAWDLKDARINEKLIETDKSHSEDSISVPENVLSSRHKKFPKSFTVCDEPQGKTYEKEQSVQNSIDVDDSGNNSLTKGKKLNEKKVTIVTDNNHLHSTKKITPTKKKLQRLLGRFNSEKDEKVPKYFQSYLAK